LLHVDTYHDFSEHQRQEKFGDWTMKNQRHLLAMAYATAMAFSAPGALLAQSGIQDRGPEFGQSQGRAKNQDLVREHDSRVFTVSPDLEFDALDGAAAYWGTYEGIQGDAAYTAEFPAEWNGGVIMYTHGFRGEGSVVTPEVPNLAFRSTALSSAMPGRRLPIRSIFTMCGPPLRIPIAWP
jgi:hypothetical protein